MWEKSIAAVANALSVADSAAADGVVLHTGSHRGKGIEVVLPRVAEALVRVFEAAPGNTLLALENAAGQGGTIGRSWSELSARRPRGCQIPRLAVCMDTCHAFAAGYNIVDPADWTRRCVSWMARWALRGWR